MGTTLHDSVATFTGDSLYPGCTIFNSTTAAMGTLLEVISDQELRMQALQGGSRQDWQVSDGYFVYPNVQCNITGGNLVAVDTVGSTISPVFPTANVQIVKTSSSSATISELELIRIAAFNGSVSIDVVDGISGTGENVGTDRYPSNNEVDAYTIATTWGINAYKIRGSLTLGRDYEAWSFISESSVNNDILNFNGYSVGKCKFDTLTLTGTATGTKMQAKDCILSSVSGWDGAIFGGGIQTSLTLGGPFATLLSQGTSGLSIPTYIDLVGDYRYVTAQFEGGIFEYLNSQANCFLSITQNHGGITMNASCISGTMIYGGLCSFVNNGTIYVLGGRPYGDMLVNIEEPLARAAKALTTGQFIALKD